MLRVPARARVVWINGVDRMSHTLDSISLTFPTLGTLDGSNPIVVIGPNGVGKSRLMRTLVPAERFVSAQRRTFLEDRIPSYSREQSQQEMRNNFANSYSQPWQLSSEIDAVFARVLGEHYAALDENNEVGLSGSAPACPGPGTRPRWGRSGRTCRTGTCPTGPG